MATEVENSVLASALEYAGMGWKVIPCYGVYDGGACNCKKRGQCKSAGKHPRIDEWQRNCTDDEEIIDGWFTKWPTANVGVRLGPQSGIVDIEFDDEEGRKVADRLLGECYTPTYTSGRSVHRLFKYSGDLPHQKSVTKIAGLEFRFGTEGEGAQSVLPPSRHKSGRNYEWVAGLSPAEVGDVADVPDSILAIFHNVKSGDNLFGEERKPSERHKLYTRPEIIETVDGRDNVFIAEATAMWGEQFKIHGEKCFDDPQVQTTVYERLWSMNRAKCKPPLDDDDIAIKCTRGRDYIRKSANRDREANGPALTDLGLEYHDGEFWPGTWHVECVNSDPPLIRLFAPFLPKGFIELATDEYDSARKVHLSVFGATGTVFLDDGIRPWETIWNGAKKAKRRALAAKLLDDAKKIEAPNEVKRQAVLAQFVLDFIYEKPLTEKEPDATIGKRDNRFIRGGDVWIHFDAMIERAEFRRSDKITRQDISRCVRSIGAKDKLAPVSGRRKRFMTLDRSAVEKLQALAECQDVAHARTPI